MSQALANPFARRLPSPELAKAIDRVHRLQPGYARAVQRMLCHGNVAAVNVMLPLIDAARERATEQLVATTHRPIAESSVLEAHRALADLMEVFEDASSSETSPRSWPPVA